MMNYLRSFSSRQPQQPEEQPLFLPDFVMQQVITSHLDVKGLLKLQASGKKWHNVINECFRRFAERDMPGEYFFASHQDRSTWKQFYFCKKEFTYANHVKQLNYGKSGNRLAKASIIISGLAISVLLFAGMVGGAKLYSDFAIQKYMREHGCSQQEAIDALRAIWQEHAINANSELGGI
jgi:hypothetical protein